MLKCVKYKIKGKRYRSQLRELTIWNMGKYFLFNLRRQLKQKTVII